MLFISFVTKSILLCISSIVFIIFIKASNVWPDLHRKTTGKQSALKSNEVKR
jgi:hypothetical protein